MEHGNHEDHGTFQSGDPSKPALRSDGCRVGLSFGSSGLLGTSLCPARSHHYLSVLFRISKIYIYTKFVLHKNAIAYYRQNIVILMTLPSGLLKIKRHKSVPTLSLVEALMKVQLVRQRNRRPLATRCYPRSCFGSRPQKSLQNAPEMDISRGDPFLTSRSRRSTTHPLRCRERSRTGPHHLRTEQL